MNYSRSVQSAKSRQGEMSIGKGPGLFNKKCVREERKVWGTHTLQDTRDIKDQFFFLTGQD